MVSSRKRFLIFFAALTMLLSAAVLFGCQPADPSDVSTVPVIDDDTSDTTVVQYVVTFKSNGGTSVESQRLNANSHVVKPKNPTKENYDFLGWYVDSYFSKEWIFNSDEVTSSITLYARWKPSKKILLLDTEYSINGNTISITLDSDVDSISLTDKIMLSDDNYMYTVYEGTSIDSLGEPLFRSNVADFTQLSRGKNSFIIYVTDYALNYKEHFFLNINRKQVYTIRFWGLDNLLFLTKNYTEGETVTMPNYAPAGYDVIGWQYAAATIKPSETIIAQKDADLYAECKEAVYTINLDAQGGNLSSSTHNVTYGSAFNFPIPAKEGHYFVGWKTTNNIELTGSNGTSLNAWYYTNVFTVYAEWEAYAYSLRLRTIVDGIETETKTLSATHGSDQALSIDAHPTSAGSDYVYYVFCGWYDGSNCLSASPEFNYSNVSSSANVDAVWVTIAVQNACDKTGCAQNHFSVTPQKISGNDKLDYALAGEIVDFTAVDDQNTHSFLRWQGNRTSSDRTIRINTSANAVRLSCNWTEYELHIVSAVESDWNVSVTDENNINSAVLSTGMTVCIPSGNTTTLTATSVSGTDLTFAGWYADDDFNTLLTEAISPVCSFVMNSESKTIYAKWIDSPITIHYLGGDTDPTLQDHIDIILNYQNNYCGSNFSIAANVDAGYYFGGVFTDPTGNTVLDDMIIPTEPTNVYVKVVKTPITVTSSIMGAGKISYKLTEIKDGVANVKAQKDCSLFGETSVFEEGLTYSDVLTLSASTYNGYFWLGWYYSNTDSNSQWTLLTNKKELDIKLSGQRIAYRATWKKIETDIKVTVINNSVSTSHTNPGSATYVSKMNSDGSQLLVLNAKINPGYCFEGWFIKKFAYDADDSDSYVSEENYLLSYDNNIELNISELSSNCDLSTIEAHFSELESDILFLRDSPSDTTKKLVSSVDGVYNAYFTGHYEIVDSVKTLYQELTIELYQLLSSGNLSRNEILIGSFNNVYLAGNSKKQDIGSANIPGLIRSSAATYHRENNTVTYLFNMTTLYDSVTTPGMEYPLLFNYLTIEQNYEGDNYENEPTTKPVSIINTTTGEGEYADKIKISSYKTFCILEAVPARGNVFLYWEITDTNSPLSTNSDNPNPSYSTDPFIYRNDIGYLTYTAYWKAINTADVKLFAVKNIEDAGETFVSGQSVYVSSDTYDMAVNLTAKTNSGYLFLGWYDEEGNLISANENYSFVCRDLLSYFGREGVKTYYARWAEISAHIMIDEVAEYSLTGFISKEGKTYYTVKPVSDIYFNGNAGYYKGYYFIGWYKEDGTLYSTDYFIENQPESTFPTKLFAKWTNTPKEVLPEDMMRYFRDVDISAFDISVEVSGRGNATYAFSRLANGTTVVMFYAEPNSGYKFNGWFTDSALNNESIITSSALYSPSLQELFYNNSTGQYTLRVKLYASFISIDVNLDIDRTSVSSLFSDASIATPTCRGYRTTETDKTLYKFNAGVKNGFVFVRWKISPNDSSSEQSFFEPELEFTYNSSVALNVVAVYSQITNGAGYVIKNTSEYAGSVIGYAYYLSETERRIRFILNPNNGFSFWKIVAESATERVEYQFDNNSTDWSCAGSTIVTTINDQTLNASFSTNYKYSVYWKSVWQSATHFTEINEYINHNSVYITGQTTEKAYSTGAKNYVNTITLESVFDLEEYTFIGWYKTVQNENITETVYCKNSNNDVFTEYAPETSLQYACKWGYYSVYIEMSDEEQMTSPDGYSATIDFVTQDMRKSSHEFISEIGFAYMDEYNPELLNRIASEGYQYSKVDLNGSEGGKIVYLIWKKKPVSGINTTFITAVSMRDASMPYRANVLFADEANAHLLSSVTQLPADLNFGVGSDPVYCYFSYESGYGKPIAELGVEINGYMSDFVGRYQYCDSVDRVNVTPYSDNRTYIVFNRQETVITQESDSTIVSQKVSTTQKLFYPTQLANIGNVQDGLLFAGWYDNAETSGKPYDFSRMIYGDLTLYAKWYSLQDYNATASQVLSLGIANSYPQNNGTYYFTGLSDAEYTINLRTESSTMTQSVLIYNVNTAQTIYNNVLTDSTSYGITVPVSGGDLYRVELNSVGATGRIELQLSGRFPDEGGTFRNLIPYLDDFSITAVPFENETFLGWFNREGVEISDYTNVSYSGSEPIFTLHNKKYSMYSFEITDDIYLYGKFNYYSMKIINPETESGEYRFLGELSVGSEIELRATSNGGFVFKEWMLYDPETGEIKSIKDDYRFITDLKTAADEAYSPEMSVYKFRMLEQNLIFIVTWTNVNDNTYPPDSYVKYDINYEEAYVNAPENRTTFYYTDPSSTVEGNRLNTEPFALIDPMRYETEKGVSGHYIFEGWYYRNPISGEEYSLYNESKKRYIVDPSVAIQYAETGKVSIYAKWSEPVPDITVYTDESTGQQYIYLGEYQSSYVDPNSVEFSEINTVAEQDGYYYNRSKTQKYYKEGDMYFRVEKIRWDILRKDTENVLLQAHELFMTSQFNYTTNQEGNLYANNWEYSYLREYLNGEFMSTVFNSFEINLIKKKLTSVNNKPEMGSPSFNDKSVYPWVVQNNTEDYLYLLSYAEAMNIMYGFNSSANKACDLRKAGYTEYYDMVLSDNDNTKGYYWLRSPGNNETNVFVVDDNGRILLDKNVTYDQYGIRPVMKLLNKLVFD